MEVQFSVNLIHSSDNVDSLERGQKPSILQIYFMDLGSENKPRLISKFTSTGPVSEYPTNLISQYIEVNLETLFVSVVEETIQAFKYPTGREANITGNLKVEDVGYLLKTPEYAYIFTNEYMGDESPVYRELAYRLHHYSGNENYENYPEYYILEELDRLIERIVAKFV